MWFSSAEFILNQKINLKNPKKKAFCNSNIFFNNLSSDGLLVARYHKHNLYYEESFNTPPQPEIITFETPFAGRFGLIICYDILFRDPTIALVEEVEKNILSHTNSVKTFDLYLLLFQGVRQLIFPTAWINGLPLLDSVQFQRAFSAGANVTLLAANLRYDRLRMKGSGIYTPFSAHYHHAKKGDPEDGRLIVARVPVLDPLWVSRSKDVEMTGSSPTVATTTDPLTFTSSMLSDPYKFVLLNETEGDLTVCDGTLCCHLQYKWTVRKEEELYALGAFAGTHVGYRRYVLQVRTTNRIHNFFLSRCIYLSSPSAGVCSGPLC